MKKEENAILPDGTIYFLTATWVADPKFEMQVTSESQTEHSESADIGVNTDVRYIAIPYREQSVQTVTNTRTIKSQTCTTELEPKQETVQDDHDDIPCSYIS